MVEVKSRAVAGITALVGRQGPLGEVRARLAEGARVVNVCGSGGVGKTRLVEELRDQLVAEAVYGKVGFVYLYPIFESTASPSREAAEEGRRTEREMLLRRIFRAIAGALNLVKHLPAADDPESLMKVLIDEIGDRRILLILDNCEPHVELVGDVLLPLLAAPGLQVVTTSREFLHLTAVEHLVHLRPLAVPAEGSTREDAASADAMTVFLARAAAAGLREDVLADPDEWAAALGLVRMSDGLPLQLELLAADLRVRQLPSKVLEVHQPDSGLSASFLDKDRVSDHQRNATSVAASHWKSCSPEQQLLWARLTMFSAAFTPEAAEAVCAGGPIAAGRVAALLAELVSRSIFSTGPSGRYSQHGILRAYGKRQLEKLIAAGDEDEQRLQESYCAWAESFADTAARSWFGRDERRWLRKLKAEMPNIAPAVRWCKRTGQISRGEAIFTSVAQVRAQFFYAFEGELGAWADELHDQQPAEPTLARVEALASLVFIRVVLGDKERGRRHVEELKCALGQLPGAETHPAVKVATGTYELFHRNNSGALQLLAEAVEGFRAAGQKGPEHMALLLLALGAGVFGPAELADDASRQCLAHAREHESPWAESWALWTTGLPRCSAPADVLRDALRTQIDIGDTWGTTWSVEAEAWRRALQGTSRWELRLAARLLGGAVSLQDRHGVRISGLEPFRALRTSATDRIVDKIGLADFRTAYTEGAKKTTEQIFAMALQHSQELDEVLAPKEQQIAAMKVNGLNNAAIGAKLGMRIKTVESYVTRIYKMTGTANLAELERWFKDQGLA